MKKAAVILLIIFLTAVGSVTTEYMSYGKPVPEAAADTAEGEGAEVLYVLTDEGASGIRKLPYEIFRFKGWDVMAEIKWYFTPEEEKVLTFMSLEQKIGQLFMVRPEAVSGSTSMTGSMWDALVEKKPGGIIMFADNIIDPDQIRTFNKELMKASSEYCLGQPMFIAVDEEGGLVARVANNWNFDVKRYDSMLAVGNTGDPSEAEAVGDNIGRYLKNLNFNLDLAPVADCFTNPYNTVIGDRSFGADPELVADMVEACIKGFHSQEVMTSIKHYPGHGDTDSDTHTGTVMTYRSWEEMKERELIPFIRNLDITDMVMAAHIVSEGVTGDGVPATLSHVMIQEKLRDELGYEGVVITDAMEMGAISSVYSSDEAAILAINAGCDIILCPMDFGRAYEGLMEAVKDGRVTQERIDESVLRILRLKLKYRMVEADSINNSM